MIKIVAILNLILTAFMGAAWILGHRPSDWYLAVMMGLYMVTIVIEILE